MTKEKLVQWLLRHGYKTDKFGHYQKQVAVEGELATYRYKLQELSARYEKRIYIEGTQYTKGKGEWLRLRSAYYKDLSLSPDDKLRGMKP